MKKILFAINTLGTGGAEVSLIEVLKKIDLTEYEVSLLVMMNQGELVDEVPESVKLLNRDFDRTPVHNADGLKRIGKYARRKILFSGNLFANIHYIVKNGIVMAGKGAIHKDKLAWKPISRGTLDIPGEYDLAVAYIEGGATYFVADRVKAARKVAVVHTDYSKAGYFRKLDGDAYFSFDKIYTVSLEGREAFLNAYPELEKVTEVFPVTLDVNTVERKALMNEGFEDSYEGIRILSIGSLKASKSYELSVDAMKKLKDEGVKARWYVIGEGDRREFLKECIKRLQLEEDFILLGSKANPYPFLKQCDVFVNTSSYEGRSIALQEAQALAKPIVVTDCGGNRELVEDGLNGIRCEFNPEAVARGIVCMTDNKVVSEKMGIRARERLLKSLENNDSLQKLTEIID